MKLPDEVVVNHGNAPCTGTGAQFGQSARAETLSTDKRVEITIKTFRIFFTSKSIVKVNKLSLKVNKLVRYIQIFTDLLL
jgi:hypothetical protein